MAMAQLRPARRQPTGHAQLVMFEWGVVILPGVTAGVSVDDSRAEMGHLMEESVSSRFGDVVSRADGEPFIHHDLGLSVHPMADRPEAHGTYRLHSIDLCKDRLCFPGDGRVHGVVAGSSLQSARNRRKVSDSVGTLKPRTMI
jgi:hypothetical protein